MSIPITLLEETCSADITSSAAGFGTEREDAPQALRAAWVWLIPPRAAANAAGSPDELTAKQESKTSGSAFVRKVAANAAGQQEEAGAGLNKFLFEVRRNSFFR